MTPRVHEKINLTPFLAELGFCMDASGREVAVAALKATFRFDARGRVTVADPKDAVPVFTQDVYYGDPSQSSLRYASDIVPLKPGTDVALNGHVYGRGTTEVEAGFRLGTLEKTVLAFGPRSWFEGSVVGPLPFAKVELRYENAYGGAFEDPELGRVCFNQNPVGVGFANEMVEKAPLPSLEHSMERFHSVRDRPPPASLGFIPCGWPPRVSFAGTFDGAWMESRRPLFPKDFDDRFFNAVPQDQVAAPKVVGGEQLVLRGVSADAEIIALELPRLTPTATFNVKERSEEIPMVADTVLIEPDEGRLAITYRSTCGVGDDLKLLRTVVFECRGVG